MSTSPNLNCTICQQTYKKPRILPCGESACSDCLKRILEESTSDSRFNCALCDQNHLLAKLDDFPPNKFLQAFMKQLKIEENRKCFNELQKYEQIVKSFKSQLEDMHELLENGSTRIMEYCSFIKDDIEVYVESMIVQLKKYQNEFLQQVNQYQRECVQNFQCNKEPFVKHNLKELNCQISYLDELCKAYLIDYDTREKLEIFKMDELVEKIKLSLKQEKKNLEKLLFNGKILKYNENLTPINSGVLGLLSFIRLTIPRFEDLIKIDLTYGNHLLALEALENDKLVCLYETNEFSLVLRNLSGQILTTNTIPKRNARYKLFAYKNMVILVQDYAQYFETTFYDEKLSVITKCSINGRFTSMSASDSMIYFLMDDNQLKIVNWKSREILFTSECMNEHLPFYVPTASRKLIAFDDKLFIQHNDYITILNSVDGHFIRTIHLQPIFHFLIDRSKSCILIMSKIDDHNLKKLVYYDFEGRILQEYDLLNYPNALKLNIVSQGGVIFLDDANQQLYV